VPARTLRAAALNRVPVGRTTSSRSHTHPEG
jgi:hypothetical protein